MRAAATRSTVEMASGDRGSFLPERDEVDMKVIWCTNAINATTAPPDLPSAEVRRSTDQHTILRAVGLA